MSASVLKLMISTLVEPDLLEQILLGGDVPLAIAEPRLDAHLYRPALRRCRNVLRRAPRAAALTVKRGSAGPDDVAAIWCPDHVQLSLVSNATKTILSI